ncbi:hypothetical protein [uncultured Sphingomonas sp.]|uniref:hypothetical protein n=1 Tax=uncultured Sphingomonas sp. TaxID=158754 RepID=UPI0035CB9F22
MFPTCVYVLVAAAIALIAFGIAQVVPGAGIWFVVLTSTAWVAFNIRRGQRLR